VGAGAGVLNGLVVLFISPSRRGGCLELEALRGGVVGGLVAGSRKPELNSALLHGLLGYLFTYLLAALMLTKGY